MIIPIRCMTCNMVLGSKYESYLRKLEENQINPTDSDVITFSYLILRNFSGPTV